MQTNLLDSCIQKLFRTQHEQGQKQHPVDVQETPWYSTKVVHTDELNWLKRKKKTHKNEDKIETELRRIDMKGSCP